MTTKAAYIESLDPNIILSGDIIGMQVDALGLMCTPAASEPIPEKEECVSHLRISSSHKKSSTADYRRCMFKIENDSGEVSYDALCIVSIWCNLINFQLFQLFTENKHYIRLHH